MRLVLITLLMALAACESDKGQIDQPSMDTPTQSITLELQSDCDLPQTLNLIKSPDATFYDYEHDIELTFPASSYDFVIYIHEKIGESFISAETLSGDINDDLFEITNGCTYKEVRQ